eukprot:TRINITY_DN19678_c0_g1_i1.p1 TRINITY_DN19678_c0_g1~~TRINITY_DN19678_c0_g1_i1.p1  ORF type:complete len:466 (+),score=14.22 TRINITY_DN19678_c0_g1_i1:31-1428(+)
MMRSIALFKIIANTSRFSTNHISTQVVRSLPHLKKLKTPSAHSLAIESHENHERSETKTPFLSDLKDDATGVESPLPSEGRKGTEDYLMKTLIGTIVLPRELVRRVRTVLKGISRSELKMSAGTLSLWLRAKTTDQPIPNREALENRLVGYNKQQALGYVAHRLPGVYGCTYRVFNEIALRMPEFCPQTILDFGSGPGTAIWSAKQVWQRGITSALAVEPSTAMSEVASQLLRDYVDTQWRRFLFHSKENVQHDLVVSSYVLTELSTQEERNAIVSNLWLHTRPGGVLVIVEPGTPLGFDIIKEARQLVLSSTTSATEKPEVVTPCPHSDRCPMKKESWCHFAQRIERIDIQLLAKANSSVSYEDEKFSFVAIRKGQSAGVADAKNQAADTADNLSSWKNWDKIIRAPIKKAGHIVIDTCSTDGELSRNVITKSQGTNIYKAARRSHWGDFVRNAHYKNKKPLNK